ncbi:fibronectin type III domain-containing protein [bacterium]|nr:fibronectin type III domain-containing protein [bacterium]
MKNLLLLCFVLLLVSCFTEIDNSNPFDPNYKLNPPTNLQLSSLTDSEVRLDWDFEAPAFKNEKQKQEFEKITKFQIQRSTDGTNFTEIATVQKDTTNYTDSGLLTSENYTYRVKAFTNSNSSAFATSQAVQTSFPAPSNLQFLALSDSEVRLTWNDNSGFEQGFKIERKTENSGFTEIATLPTNTTNYTDSGLFTSENYTYRVKAFNTLNSSAFTTSQAVQTSFPAPSNLQIVSLSDSQVKLTWNDNSGFEQGFKIEKKTGSNTFTEIATLPTNTTNYTDSGLLTSENYTYRVKAFNTLNSSAFATSQAVQTSFPAPSNLQIVSLSDSQVKLTWNDNTSFEQGFKIERKTENSGFTEIATVPKDTTNYTDSGLLTSENYTYRVKAFTSVNSSFSEEKKIQFFTAGALFWTGNHSNRVWSVSFSPDGSKVASGSYSYDNTVKIWNASDGSLIWTGNHSGDIYSVSFSPDGSKVASGSYQEVKIWNASDGSLIWTGNHSNRVWSVSFSLDGSKVASGSWDNTVKVWNASDGSLIWTGNHSYFVNSVSFSPDGSKVASGSEDNTLKVWNASDGSLIWTGNHSYYVNSVSFSPDGSKVVSGSDDNTVKIWNASDGSLLWTGNHSNDVYSVSFSPDGSKVVSGSYDNTLKVWNASDGSLLWTGNHSNDVYSVSFSPDGSKVVSGSYDHTVKVWNAVNGSLLWTGNHDSYVFSVSFSPDGSKVASGSFDNTLKVWTVVEGWYEVP